MNLLSLSWKNLISKPLNLFLNVVLFALGVGLVSFLLLINTQLEDKFEKNLAGIDMVVGAKGSPLQLILSSMYHVDAPTGNIPLKSAKPFLNPKHPLIETAIPLSLGDNYQGNRIVGTTPQILDLYDAEIGEGALWSKDFQCVVGANVANDQDLKIGSAFHSAHGLVHDELGDDLMTHAHHDFVVSGILKPTGSVIDQLILTSTETIWHVHEEEESAADAEESEEAITSILVKFKSHNFRTLSMPRAINENTNMQATSPAVQMNMLYANIGVGEKALRWLAALIIGVSMLSIFISLFSSLKDRKYELAIMRVMGASPAKNFALILTEGLLLALIGCIIGLVLSHGGMALLAGKLKEAYRYEFDASIFLKDEIYLILGALVIGLVAALIPAIQASRTDISETLGEN